MPFAAGGGIRKLEDIRRIVNAGAEKVVINTYAYEDPKFIQQAADEFGSSTIVVSIDVRKKLFGNKNAYILGGTLSTKRNPLEFAQEMANNGAGELIINSIDHDGMMQGYDMNLVKSVSDAVSIPVVAMGGAGTIADFRNVCIEAHANAAGAGSMFVYHGSRNAVLINYPTNNQLKEIFQE